jgi:hypothetical protein
MWRARETRVPLLILGFVFGALVAGVVLLGTPADFPVAFSYGKTTMNVGISAHALVGVYVAFLLASLVYFVPRFAAPEDRTGVDEFYRNLDTPVDVATEVTGSAQAAISVFKLVGVLTFIIAGLVAVLGILEQIFESEHRSEWWKYAMLIGIFAILGGLFLLAVRKTTEVDHAAVA